MKHIVLHCACYRSQRFSGRNVAEILAAIDNADWQDLPDDDRLHDKGHAPGICPECSLPSDADLPSSLLSM